MAGGKPAFRSTKGVTRRSPKGVTTRKIGPRFLTADDDAKAFSMTYVAKRFNSSDVLQDTRTGSAFIFGEGLQFILDRTFVSWAGFSFDVQAFPWVAGGPPLATDKFADIAGEGLPGGSTHSMASGPDAVGTNPYTKGSDNVSNMSEFVAPATVDGYWIESELISPANRFLIALCEFSSPYTLASGDYSTLETVWRIDR